MPRVSRKYATMGLRRENNLSDVANTRVALNNLLNNLVNDPDPTKTFISEDLDVIRGLQNSNIISEKIQGLKGATINYSILSKNTDLPSYTKPGLSILVAGSTVTVTTSTDHDFLTNDYVYIENSINPIIDGPHRVTVLTSTTFNFSIVNDNNIAGEQLLKIIDVAGDNVSPKSTVTITTNVPHGLAIGDSITIGSTSGANANGIFVVESVPSTTTFTYIAKGQVIGNVFKPGITSSFATIITETKVIETPVNPLITLKDRVENIKIITGKIPAFEGGLGLTARFVPSSNVNIGSASSTGEPGPDTTASGKTPNANGIFDFTNNQFQEVFWDRGYFSFPSTIDKSFTDQYGGIQWTGWFSPSLYDAYPEIYYETTGLVIIEHQEGATWYVDASMYAGVRAVATSGASTLSTDLTATVVPFAASNMKFIHEGDFVASLGSITVESVTSVTIGGILRDAINLSGTFSIPSSGLSLYDSVNKVVRTLTIASSTVVGGKTIAYVSAGAAKLIKVGQTVVTYFQTSTNTKLSVDKLDYGLSTVKMNGIKTGGFTSGQSLLFVKELGKDLTNGYATLPATELGGKIPIRISLWWPNTGDNMVEKRARFGYLDGDNLDYPNLYSELPSQTLTPYELRQFLKDIITPTQTEMGAAGSNGSNERSLYVGNTFLATYTPKSSFSQIKTFTAGPVSISLSPTTKIINSGSTYLYNVERGNVIVPTVARASTKINTLYQVEDSIDNTIKVASSILSTVTVATSESVNFIDHKGFIDWFYATSSGTTVTITGGSSTTTAKLRAGYTVITSTTGDTSFIRVSSITNSLNFVTSTALGLSGEQIIYVYADRGLIDSSKDVICAGVIGQVVHAEATTGATRIALKSAVGVAAGQVLYYGTSFNAGQTLTAVSTTTGTVVVTGSISGTTLTVPAGTLNASYINMLVTGTGVPANTYITAVASGTSATVSVSQTAASTTLTFYPGIIVSAPGVKSLIPASSTLVFAPNNAYNSVDRESCVIPKDTSPPFSGTEVGLKTNSNIAIKSTSPAFRVNANSLSAAIPDGTGADASHVVSISSTPTFNRKIQIYNTSGTYSILSNKL